MDPIVAVIALVLFYILVYRNPQFQDWFKQVTAKGAAPTTTPSSTPSTPSTTTTKKSTPTKTTKKSTPSTTTGTDSGGTTTTTGGTGGSCNGGNWDCITHRERLSVKNCNQTITGTVIDPAKENVHYAPDGDLVFAFMPDAQYKSLVTAKNSDKKYGGGFWVEGVCQKPNKATEPRHAGDCKCSMKKFTAPKVGDKLRITGAYVIDNAEGGQAEIHPMDSMEKLTATASLAEFVDDQNYHQYVDMALPRIRLSNIGR